MGNKNLLDKNSLSVTVDKINEVYFYGNDFSDYNVDETVKWILGRYNTEYSYRGSFGVTDKDMRSVLRTFTGEKLTSQASMRHIHAEEAGRALHILKKYTAIKMPELTESDSNFVRIFLEWENNGKHEGTFCCGQCTVSLWRNMAAGGYGRYAGKLNSGISVLKKFRKGNGQWSRFPFYYTLSALLESAKLPNAAAEIGFARDECSKKLKNLRGKDKYAGRKNDLLKKIIDL
ncbi:MAG: hypothetical protein JSS91_02880 [Bacteroidetes bacterium]|nr:hypothetical protein [Bacteroidota bacterium]